MENRSKGVGVSNRITVRHSSSVDHSRVQKSTTLNRKFVKRPVLSKNCPVKIQSVKKVAADVAPVKAVAKTVTVSSVASSSATPSVVNSTASSVSSSAVSGAVSSATSSVAKTATTGAKATIKRRNGGLIGRITRKQSSNKKIIAKQNSVKLQASAEARAALKAHKQQAKVAQSQGAKAVVAQSVQMQNSQPAKTTNKSMLTERSAHALQAQKIVAQRKTTNPSVDARMNQSSVAHSARMRMAANKAAAKNRAPITSQEMKERALSDALSKMAKVENKGQHEMAMPKKHFWQKRSFIAAACIAIVSIGLLGYLVYLNLPDLSVRVAAMQSGIENAYPSYVPMNYRLDGLVKEENGTVTMGFTRNDGGKWTLIEQKSSWDSAAVKANFVDEKWGNNYTIAKGQGLTIYISGSNAVWVNGGVLYEIQDNNSGLTADDLHDIAISL